MRDTNVYINDTIGLQELDKADKMYFRLIKNKDHVQFSYHDIFTEFIPFLYQKVWPTNNEY